MINPMRRLIVEIHRRSLWQVLAIFLATSWLVLQVLDLFIDDGVLPAWAFKAGLFLLLPGLVSAGYMGMRTLGIGGPGTRLAQGVIDRGAAVVPADFESRSDAELGEVVTQTLRIAIAEYEVVLNRRDPDRLYDFLPVPYGLRRLAAPYDALGDRQNAAKCYARFVACTGTPIRSCSPRCAPRWHGSPSCCRIDSAPATLRSGDARRSASHRVETTGPCHAPQRRDFERILSSS